MRPVVKTRFQIIDNVLELFAVDRLDLSFDPGRVHDEAKNLIRRGHAFVPVKLPGGAVLFGPSRWVGYGGNSFPAHTADDDRDGKITNPAISSVLDDELQSDTLLDTAFITLCAGLRVSPEDRDWKFWRPIAP